MTELPISASELDDFRTQCDGVWRGVGAPYTAGDAIMYHDLAHKYAKELVELRRRVAELEGK